MSLWPLPFIAFVARHLISSFVQSASSSTPPQRDFVYSLYRAIISALVSFLMFTVAVTPALIPDSPSPPGPSEPPDRPATMSCLAVCLSFSRVQLFVCLFSVCPRPRPLPPTLPGLLLLFLGSCCFVLSSSPSSSPPARCPPGVAAVWPRRPLAAANLAAATGEPLIKTLAKRPCRASRRASFHH